MEEANIIGQEIVRIDPSATIMRKRDGHPLSTEEIHQFIQGLVAGDIKDYQMSALLMAIYLNGFNTKETADLTDAMLYSGSKLEFESDTDIVDKHSTGGIGDKTSFILAPIAAACGVKVPMIAGRGLGHTGGTVDKIESIRGIETSLTLARFKQQLLADGLVLIGQTGEIAPADGLIYALRDVTATVDSIPLITASIMSKKLAEGASGLVMDIKVGNGAFMKSKADARRLAKSLRQTALRFDKNIITILSDMSQPLGNTVGNSLEIMESIETLKGRGPSDLTKLSIELAGGMIHLAGKSKSVAAGVKKAKEAVKSGAALTKFKQLIERQGGDIRTVDNYSFLPQANLKSVVTAPKSGFITSFATEEIGHMLVELGGGRKVANQEIDMAVGFTFHHKLGERVTEGEPLLTIHHHVEQMGQKDELSDRFTSRVIKIAPKKPAKKVELIIEQEIEWS
ncbi:MAG: thymidine phosphorylase [Bdellovibrionales bacterium]|nr:thymidine phosphorylase [Bdellovibrionales bacterium]MBT3525424.1 thymidine phosphorylase [Bdellovibrionales bacterium]MBT7766253.1 thymidine phosphorylase [Bdellovibrionales bacterium]